MKEKTDYKLIAKVLFQNYESIYDVNIQSFEFYTFHESDFYQELRLGYSGTDFFETIKHIVERIVVPEDQAFVMRMLSKDNLIRSVKKDKSFYFVYKVKKNKKEIFHKIRATIQKMNDGEHIFIGIKDVDDIIRQEQSHRNEISAMQQKQSNYLKAILTTATGYIEANLSKDVVIVKSVNGSEGADEYIAKRFELENIKSYSKMHKWICDNIVVDNRTEYEQIGSIEHLKNIFDSGDKRASATFSISTNDNDVKPCRELFFVYKEKGTEDLKVFCVIYDLTEEQKKDRERKELEHELSMIRLRNFTSQMQPHFLYNALGSIQETILIDPHYASELLGDFTIHLRSCIRAMTKDKPLPFKSELENIKAYVNIEKMRLGEKLRVHYNVQNEDFPVLPLSVQPIVENAIRHGIYERGVTGGDLWISTGETKNDWFILIKDNGVGFSVEEYESEKKAGCSDSTGLENIEFRMKKVMGAMLEVDSEKGKGTKVKLTIPKGEKNESNNC